MKLLNLHTTAYLAIALAGLAITSLSQHVNSPRVPFEGIWPVLLGLSITTLCLTVIHARKETKRVRHGAHVLIWLLRGLVIASLTLLLLRSIDYTFALLLSSQIALFAAVFNPLYNYYAGSSWNYAGSQAFWDKVYKKNPHLYIIVWVIIYLTTSIIII